MLVLGLPVIVLGVLELWIFLTGDVYVQCGELRAVLFKSFYRCVYAEYCVLRIVTEMYCVSVQVLRVVRPCASLQKG